MTFSEAQQALHNGKKIRHESMPEGNSFMLYRRGFGDDMLIVVDAHENLSGDDVDFCELFSSAIHDDDDAWVVAL